MRDRGAGRGERLGCRFSFARDALCDRQPRQDGGPAYHPGWEMCFEWVHRPPCGGG